MDKDDLIASLKKDGFPNNILNAFKDIRREDFIPDDFKKDAYRDIALPTQDGQTISQPYTIAFMLSLLELDVLNKRRPRILEIGSGSGYLLALLSNILPNAKVIGLEINSNLVEISSSLLKDNKNISIINQSGIRGYKKKAPFDRIIISASAKDDSFVKSLIKQLTDKGIIVYPLKDSIIKIKKMKSDLIREEFYGFVFVPLVDD